MEEFAPMRLHDFILQPSRELLRELPGHIQSSNGRTVGMENQNFSVLAVPLIVLAKSVFQLLEPFSSQAFTHSSSSSSSNWYLLKLSMNGSAVVVPWWITGASSRSKVIGLPPPGSLMPSLTKFLST